MVWSACADLYEWSGPRALIYMNGLVRRKRRGRPPSLKPAAAAAALAPATAAADDMEDEVGWIIFDLILIVDALIFDLILIVQ
jgi:hypothetical protein